MDTLVELSLTWLGQALSEVHRGTPTALSRALVAAVFYHFYVSKRNTPL